MKSFNLPKLEYFELLNKNFKKKTTTIFSFLLKLNDTSLVTFA